MDPQLTCPTCHKTLTKEDFFCPNCGRKIKEPPASTSIGKQISVYLISFLFPPFGLVPAVRYLRQPERKAKIIGLVAILLTLVSIGVTIWYTMKFFNEYNKILNQQLRSYQNFGY